MYEYCCSTEAQYNKVGAATAQRGGMEARAHAWEHGRVGACMGAWAHERLHGGMGSCVVCAWHGGMGAKVHGMEEWAQGCMPLHGVMGAWAHGRKGTCMGGMGDLTNAASM